MGVTYLEITLGVLCLLILALFFIYHKWVIKSLNREDEKDQIKREDEEITKSENAFVFGTINYFFSNKEGHLKNDKDFIQKFFIFCSQRKYLDSSFSQYEILLSKFLIEECKKFENQEMQKAFLDNAVNALLKAEKHIREATGKKHPNNHSLWFLKSELIDQINDHELPAVDSLPTYEEWTRKG